ncbi:hypothetical protein ABQE45_08665 [Mycobacteroides chelonae]
MNTTRPVTVEIDDHPLRWHGPTGGDYLSRWLASASQRSQLDLIRIAANGLTHHYRVRRGATYNDGSPVHAQDHARAIRTALTVPYLQRFLLNIKEVRTAKESLVIELRRPAPHLPALLCSVDLAPISPCAELSSGSYERAVRTGDDEYWLKPVSTTAAPVRILVSRDPHTAPERFKRGEADVTCAMAFPLDRIPEFANDNAFHTAPLAIEMNLETVPGSLSAVNDATFRRQLLGALRYERLAQRCWHGMEAATPSYHIEAPASSAGSGVRLRLGYWDYYPNLAVAQEVATQLTENLGVQIELTPTDFASGSAQSCDLHLTLRGPLFADPICVLDILDPARRDPVLAPLLHQLSENPDDELAREKLHRAARDLCPALPLLRLRGYWLQRQTLTGHPWPPMHAIGFPQFSWSP